MFFNCLDGAGLAAGGILSWIVYRGDQAHARHDPRAFGAIVGGFVFNMMPCARRAAPGGSLTAAVAGALLMLAGFTALRRTGQDESRSAGRASRRTGRPTAACCVELNTLLLCDMTWRPVRSCPPVRAELC